MSLTRGRLCDWCHERQCALKRVWVSHKTFVLSDDEPEPEDELESQAFQAVPSGHRMLCVKCVQFNSFFDDSPRGDEQETETKKHGY